jgi:catalase
LAIIGIVLLTVVACFVYVAGWFSPTRLSEARLVDGFQQVDGIHPGFRRNHAKGVCITGNFESNGQGVRFSKAAIFAPGRVPVEGRLSLAGGDPNTPDGPRDVRAMGLRFRPRADEEWRTAMVNIPVFVVKTPQAFYEQLFASKPDPATGKPDPAKMAAFGAAHPSGFANTQFNSLNAFRFINDAGAVTAVRGYPPTSPTLQHLKAIIGMILGSRRRRLVIERPCFCRCTKTMRLSG